MLDRLSAHVRERGNEAMRASLPALLCVCLLMAILRPDRSEQVNQCTRKVFMMCAVPIWFGTVACCVDGLDQVVAFLRQRDTDGPPKSGYSSTSTLKNEK